MRVIILSALLTASAVLSATATAKPESMTYFKPLSHFLGEWGVRQVGAGFGDLFNIPPFRVELERAGMVHDGVLVGTLTINREAKFFASGFFDTLSAGTFFGKSEDDSQQLSQKVNESGIAPEVLQIPFRLETDSTLLGGTFTLGEGHEQDEEAEDAQFVPVKGPADTEEEEEQGRAAAKATKRKQQEAAAAFVRPSTMSGHYQFYQSVGDFHPFKVMQGKCPAIPAKSKGEGEEAGPLADWWNLIRATNLRTAAETSTSKKTQDGDDAEETTAVPLDWRWCSSYQMQVVNKDLFVITLIFNDGTSIQLQGNRAQRDHHDRRFLESFWYTLAFLIVVAAIKFGPKYYFRWKGVDPKMFQPGSKLDKARQQYEKMSPEQRKKLLAQQKEILAKMEKEGLLKQEAEQRKLAKQK